MKIAGVNIKSVLRDREWIPEDFRKYSKCIEGVFQKVHSKFKRVVPKSIPKIIDLKSLINPKDYLNFNGFLFSHISTTKYIP